MVDIGKLYTIKLSPEYYTLSLWCGFCYENFSSSPIGATVYENDIPFQNICSECLKLAETSLDDFRTVLHTRAKEKREEASGGCNGDYIEVAILNFQADRIESLSREVFVLPTPEDYERVREEFSKGVWEVLKKSGYSDEEISKMYEDGVQSIPVFKPKDIERAFSKDIKPLKLDLRKWGEN